MDIIDYEHTAEQEHWLRQLAACDWAAGPYLYNLLKEDRFHALCGEKARVLMLTDGTRLVSFCTYAEKDNIPDTELTPWLGFVYTFPDYRGRRLMGKLISKARELARDDGYHALYLSTREAGLYEKYGAKRMTVLKDSAGEENRIYRMDTYGFYGREKAEVTAGIPDYPGIETPKDLYRALWHVWSRETCTARMRADWSEDNRTLGQCAVTAFLAQDIFGGKVWGIPLKEGGFHCFNEAEGCVFDLTSEQFGNQPLDYSLTYEQRRNDHFMQPGKKARYEALKTALKARQTGRA